MEEPRGPCGEATRGPESERVPQEPPEEATVDLEIVRESTTAAKGESYSNLAGETTGNQNDAAEGDVLNLASNHLDGINESDLDVEIISNSCSDTTDCVQVPEETTRMEASVARKKNSRECLSPNVVCETSCEVPSDNAEHRESTDDLSHLSNGQRQNLMRKELKQLVASARADGLSYLTRHQIQKLREKQGPEAAAAYAELGSTGGLYFMSKQQRRKLRKKLRQEAAAGVTGGDLSNLAGRISKANSDVEIISHLCWGPPDSLQVPEESALVGVSPGERLSSYDIGRQLTGSFTGMAKQIQSINGQKQKALPISGAFSLPTTSHLTKGERRNLKRKQTKQLVAAAQADNLGRTTKNQRQKLRRMLQTHQAAATHSGQVGSTDDLSHLSKNQRKKLRRMQREQAAAADKEKLGNSEIALTRGLKNEPCSQKRPENTTTSLTNENGGSTATERVSYSSFTSEITGNVTQVPSTGERDLSNLASNHSGRISDADSDVEILFNSCQGTVECIHVPEVTTKIEVSPEGKKRARERLSSSPICEVSSDKAECDESTNDFSHLTKRRWRYTRRKNKQQAADGQYCENGDVSSAQRPEREAGSQETPGDATVKQTIVKDGTAAAGGELHSSLAGRTAKNSTEVTSTAEGDLTNLNSNNLAGMSEGDSDVEIVFHSHQVTPECIDISDDALEMDVSPSGGKKSEEVPSSGVVGSHLTDRDKQMASNNNLTHLPKKKNWKESKQHVQNNNLTHLPKKKNGKESKQHVQKLKLTKEQAAAKKQQAAAKKQRKVEITLTKAQKRTLNNLLLSVGIIRGNLSAKQNVILRPVKAAIAAGNVSIYSEVLQKFVAEVRGEVAGSVGSVKANERVRVRTNDRSSAWTAKAVKPPQAKHLSAAVEKRISKIQKGYQSWVPSSEPVSNKTQSEDAVRNEDAIKNNQPSENVNCMPSLPVGEAENAQCLTQFLNHQLTIQNLLRKDDTKFVVRVPVFNTQDDEVEFVAKHLKKTVGDSIFRGPDGLSLPPVIEPNFSQQSCGSEYNSNLPSSSGPRVTESELHHMYDQQFREQGPSPMLKSRFRESNPSRSHEAKFADSFPHQSLEPQITVNRSLQAQDPQIMCRNPVEADNQVSTGTSPVHLREPCFKVTIPTYPYNSLHSERNAPEWLGAGASHPVTLEHCGRSRSPHSSREGSCRSISSRRSHEGSRMSRSPHGSQEHYGRSRSSLRFQEGYGRSRSPHQYQEHSHRSRSPLRHEEQFHRGRSLTRSRELLRRSSPRSSYDTQFRGRRAARSRNAFVHIKLSQFNGGSRRPMR